MLKGSREGCENILLSPCSEATGKAGTSLSRLLQMNRSGQSDSDSTTVPMDRGRGERKEVGTRKDGCLLPSTVWLRY